MILVLGWRVADRPIATRWRGPAGMVAALERDPLTPVAAIVGPPGPPGPPGSGGGGGAAPQRFDFAASAIWTVPHGLGFAPQAQVFLASGEQVFPDLVVDAAQIAASFASPASGYILTSAAAAPPGRFDFTAAANWIAPHGLGRAPQVQVFLASGEQVLPDVVVSTTQIAASFASPASGFVLAS